MTEEKIEKMEKNYLQKCNTILQISIGMKEN